MLKMRQTHKGTLISSKISVLGLEELLGFPSSSNGKASTCNAGDPGSIPGSGRSSEKGNGNPLQYSCLENFMDRGAWWAMVHGVAKSQTRQGNFHSLTHSVQLWSPCSSCLCSSSGSGFCSGCSGFGGGRRCQ